MSWRRLEQDFWRWLVKEAESAESEWSMASTVELDEGVNAEDWKRLVGQFQASLWRQPRNVTCELRLHLERNKSETWHQTIRVVFEGENCWMHVSAMETPDQYLMVRGDDCVNVTRTIGGEKRAKCQSFAPLKKVRRMIASYVEPRTSPRMILPIEPGVNEELRRVKFRCKSLAPPSNQSQLWKLLFEASYADEESNGLVREEGEVYLPDVIVFIMLYPDVDGSRKTWTTCWPTLTTQYSGIPARP